MQTIESFKAAFTNFSNGLPLSGSYSYSYDAIWALALGLNRTNEILLQQQSRNLSSYNYNDTSLTVTLVGAMNNISFIGLSVSTRIFKALLL